MGSETQPALSVWVAGLEGLFLLWVMAAGQGPAGASLVSPDHPPIPPRQAGVRAAPLSDETGAGATGLDHVRYYASAGGWGCIINLTI